MGLFLTIFCGKGFSQFLNELLYIVRCQGRVQLGGPDPWYRRVGPAKVGARKSFLFTETFGVSDLKGTHSHTHTHLSDMSKSKELKDWSFEFRL